ncbi:MAG TPA: SPOR domain-containing protein [Gammaproteobacteria bacterium]|nr:SPOR domain-containing protein [Gammaproteobacteria bacterium]
MARDYKQRRKTRKQPTPGWVWLLTGLVIGLGVALFVHLQHTGRGAPAEPVATRAAKPASQQAEEDAELESVPESGFDFYTMLPGLEVVVPEEDAGPRGGSPAAMRPELAPGRYWIQAGSFRRFNDADRRKAELALLGLASSIQAVTLDGQTWHRVRIGPLADAAQAEATRRQVTESGIGALAVRERD